MLVNLVINVKTDIFIYDCASGVKKLGQSAVRGRGKIAQSEALPKNEIEFSLLLSPTLQHYRYVNRAVFAFLAKQKKRILNCKFS
jgi:hypothetical protein